MPLSRRTGEPCSSETTHLHQEQSFTSNRRRSLSIVFLKGRERRWQEPGYRVKVLPHQDLRDGQGCAPRVGDNKEGLAH